jgi:hypothetical protein
MKLDPRSILIALHGFIGDVTRASPLSTFFEKVFPMSNYRGRWKLHSFPGGALPID